MRRANLAAMSRAADNIVKQQDNNASLLSDIDSLPAAYLSLKQQLQEQTELVDKKSQVIQNQNACIAGLEEQLRSNAIERYAASSDSNPLSLPM